MGRKENNNKITLIQNETIASLHQSKINNNRTVLVGPIFLVDEIDFTFSVSTNIFRYIDIGPSPPSSRIRLFRPLLLNLFFFAQRFVTAVSVATQTQCFSAPKIFLVHSRLFFLPYILCLAQHVRWRKFLQVCAVNESIQSLWRNSSHSCLFAFHIQTYNSISGSVTYNESVPISISSYLSVSQSFVTKKLW